MRGLTSKEVGYLLRSSNGDCSSPIQYVTDPPGKGDTDAVMIARGLVEYRECPNKCRSVTTLHRHVTPAGKLALACQAAVDNLSIEGLFQ